MRFRSLRLTYLGRDKIGVDNGLAPDRRQAIICTHGS